MIITLNQDLMITLRTDMESLFNHTVILAFLNEDYFGGFLDAMADQGPSTQIAITIHVITSRASPTNIF